MTNKQYSKYKQNANIRFYGGYRSGGVLVIGNWYLDELLDNSSILFYDTYNKILKKRIEFGRACRKSLILDLE